jgi:hypothetical protein
MKPTTLMILAAGMGSRYGGLKQMDAVGPNGETIMDYSVYDALRAGFETIAFIIRHDFEDAFRKVFENRFGKGVQVKFIFQDINAGLPDNFKPNPERTKPWGTNHAVMMGAGEITQPFGVINADDFYGRQAFEVLHSSLCGLLEPNEYSMVTYQLGNTLSESGSVSRGVCKAGADRAGFLETVQEYKNIELVDGKPAVRDEANKITFLDPETPVSMNMWGFTPDYMSYARTAFSDFLAAHGQELKSEYLIPTFVDSLIKQGKAQVQMLKTSAKWFGVTYSDDKPSVVAKIKELINKGEYPENLWS